MRGRALHVSEGEAVRSHSTLAYKLVIGIDAPVRLGDADGSMRSHAILVPPARRHAMAAEGIALGIFLEPAGSLWSETRAGGAPVALDGLLARRLRGLAAAYLRASGEHAPPFVDAAVAALGPARSAGLDRRVARTLQRQAASPELCLEELASAVGLSSERLRHLVAEQTGVALRGHRRFQRTMLGVEHLLAGQTIAAAAASAGFADHAHFTRSFVDAFGRVPSSVPRDAALLGEWVERDTPQRLHQAARRP